MTAPDTTGFNPTAHLVMLDADGNEFEVGVLVLGDRSTVVVRVTEPRPLLELTAHGAELLASELRCFATVAQQTRPILGQFTEAGAHSPDPVTLRRDPAARRFALSLCPDWCDYDHGSEQVDPGDGGNHYWTFLDDDKAAVKASQWVDLIDGQGVPEVPLTVSVCVADDFVTVQRARDISAALVAAAAFCETAAKPA